MSTAAVVFDNFGGGLNLVDSPGLGDSRYAIDLLNTVFTRRGSVRQRGGSARFSQALTGRPDSLGEFRRSDGTQQLLVGNGQRVDVLDAGGAVVASLTTPPPSASPHSFVRFGTPVFEAVYIANGQDQVRKWDGTAFSSPAGLTGRRGKFLAVTPRSNRLMVARAPGTLGGDNPSSVSFSEAGDPETFGATDFIQLDPGDGEPITGMVSWGQVVLIFKRSKFWRFYGESVDSVGGPVFNVDKVDTGGTGLVASQAVAATPVGVFFLAADGVYLTSGGDVSRVSGLIDPFFTGDAAIYFRSRTINHDAIDQSAMCWHDNRLYVAVPTGGSAVNDTMLVFDPQAGWWSLYDLPASALLSYSVVSQPELVYGRASGANVVCRHKTGRHVFEADDMEPDGTGGAAITSRWRSAFVSHGTVTERRINNVLLWGTGTCEAAAYRNFETTGLSALTASVVFTTEDAIWDTGAWDSTLWGSSATITRKALGFGFQEVDSSLAVSNSTYGQTWELVRAAYLVNSDADRPPGNYGNPK